MELVFQQAIGEQVRDRSDVFFEQSQKQIIVSFFDEDILTVHTAVVDVIAGIVKQWRGISHVSREPKGFPGLPASSRAEANSLMKGNLARDYYLSNSVRITFKTASISFVT